MSTSPEPRSPKPRRDAPAEAGWRSLLVALRWPLVFVVVSILAYLAWIDSLDRAERAAKGVTDAAGQVLDRAGELARGLVTAEVTERFMSSLPEIDRSGVGRLEVARAEIVETFSRSEDRRAFWDVVPLGRTTVEIQVPVTYRYHLRLDDPWLIEVQGPVARVHAPELRPSQPPAIDTSRVMTRTEESLLRTDAQEQLDEMRRSLTPRLRVRAASPGHVDLVRDEARRQVADFVRNWLLGEGWWGVEGGFTSVEVIFADEEGHQLPATYDPEEPARITGPSVRIESADDG